MDDLTRKELDYRKTLPDATLSITFIETLEDLRIIEPAPLDGHRITDALLECRHQGACDTRCYTTSGLLMRGRMLRRERNEGLPYIFDELPQRRAEVRIQGNGSNVDDPPDHISLSVFLEDDTLEKIPVEPTKEYELIWRSTCERSDGRHCGIPDRIIQGRITRTIKCKADGSPESQPMNTKRVKHDKMVSLLA